MRISGWPAGPEITSETGVLMDADSGTLLYSKGGDEIRYPASITKIMTLLLAVENCSLKEDVVFTEQEHVISVGIPAILECRWGK